jgi:Thioredoxin domain-containing protein
MKKLFLLILSIGILLSIGIYLWQSRLFNSNEIADITPNQLQQMIEKGGKFYVYFYSPICEQCIESEPKLIQAVKDLKLNNIVKVDVQKYSNLKQDLQIQGTPTIYVYSNRKIIKGITGGLKNIEEYKSFFRETGATS